MTGGHEAASGNLFKLVLILFHPLPTPPNGIPVDLRSQYQGEWVKQGKIRRIQLMVQFNMCKFQIEGHQQSDHVQSDVN